MKAAVSPLYGPPEILTVADVPTPVPGDREVLVRIHASTVCYGDWFIRKGPPLVRVMNGLLRPKVQILGVDLAGTVESVGRSVTKFAAGDQVFGTQPVRPETRRAISSRWYACGSRQISAVLLRGLWTQVTGTARFLVGAAVPVQRDLYYLKDLIEAGNLRTVIGRSYPLTEIAEAHRYAESGHKVGNVLILVNNAPRTGRL